MAGAEMALAGGPVTTDPRQGAVPWGYVLRIGAIAAVLGIYSALVGFIAVFHQRPLITGIISLGEVVPVLIGLGAGYLVAQRTAAALPGAVVGGAIAGAIGGAALSALVLLGSVVNLRAVLLQATSDLYAILTVNLGTTGFWVPLVVGAVCGALGAGAQRAPRELRRSLIVGVIVMLVLGVFAGLIRTPLLAGPLAPYGRLLFNATGGLTLIGAIATLAVVVGYDMGPRLTRRLGASSGGRIGAIVGGAALAIILGIQGGPAASVLALVGAVVGVAGGAYVGAVIEKALRQARWTERVEAMPATQQRAVEVGTRTFLILIGLLFIIWLPLGVGPFFAQVVVLVALYILMGLGLNITLGLAGLLDLGFVAFFAVGAYTVGLLTSTAEYGIAGLSWWAAVPFAVIIAMIFGAFLGLPILGIRGDYLAIATLGFGEIIRILAGSNLLLPILGGPRGIINVPKPIEVPPDNFLAGPVQIYYIALVCAALVAFVAWRLRGSRLGRAWLAVREDEDVAEALGVNLVQTKLLAYMLGAAFAGLGGAVFAALVGSIFPSSINFFVSINVAALLIVGGMGSIPGVVVGAIFLIGVPELFREFSEYRLLFYGVALIAVMRFRPEGLLPSRVTERELHVDENVEASGSPVGARAAALEAAED